MDNSGRLSAKCLNEYMKKLVANNKTWIKNKEKFVLFSKKYIYNK